MSTKMIAVDSSVYERLAANKREGESFSKAIDRLLSEVGAVHTGGDILHGLTTISALSLGDAAEAFLEVVAENREREDWGDS